MDDATIAGNLNQALCQASGSSHFHEHPNEVGDTLVIDYHFTVLPEKIGLKPLFAVFDSVDNVYWTDHHQHSAVNIDGVIGDRKVSVEISLRKESI